MKPTTAGLTPALLLALAGAIGACSSNGGSTDGGRGGAGGSSNGGAGGSAQGGADGGRGGAGGGTTDGGAGGATTDGGTGGTTTDGGGDGSAQSLAMSTGAWVIFPNPFADGGANPITTVTGTVEAFANGATGMRLVLTVSGLPVNRAFGSHLHRQLCSNGQAGTHYQNDGDAGASNTNEAWLDFTTNASGAATSTATVTWRPRPGEAQAVVIHNMTTAAGTGAAGPKLACINIPF